MRAESFEQLIGWRANFCRKQHQRRRQLAHRIALQQPPAISRLSISQSELASGAMRAVYITSDDDDDDENKMMLHRWQHETTTTTRTSSSVIIFVISTCVLLLGLHLTQHTIGAIDDDIALPGFRAARAPLARAGSNLSAHYPTYYDLVKLPAERQTTDIVTAPQVDSTKSARKSNRRAIETSKLDDVSSAEPKHGTDRRAHRTDARGAKNRTNLLDEEIETMEALIEVLDAANKKLAEQKRRQKFKRAEGTNSGKSQPARADFSVTRASTGAAAANSFNATLDKRTRFDQEQPRADPSEQVKSEATRDGAARPLRPSLSRAGLGEKEERRRTDAAGGESTGEKKKDKKRKFKRKKSKDRLAPYNATQILDSPSSRPSKSTKPLPELRHLNESKRSTSSASSDSDQVRPGFDNTPMSQNYVGQYRAHPMGVTLDPLGGMVPAEPPEHMQQMHGPHLLLHGHRPIVAHDLLNTQQPPPSPPPQQQHEPNQYDNNIEDERVRHSGQPEVFVPDHVQQQPVGGDYRGFTGGGGPMYESHPQAPTTLGYPASPLQALQMLKRQQLLGYGPYQGLIQQHPAYGYSTTTERPHDKPVVSVSERDHNQPAGGSKPVDDWTPVAGAPVHAGKPHRGEPQAAGVEPTPPTGHAPETATQPQTNQLLNNRFGDMNGGVNQLAGLGAPNPTLAAMNPLQHLLDAAKNQQAAALAYERGRLNYELELRKREETMRQQHEANMERQQLAANQRAAAQEQERQQNQQQSNELNGQREQSGTGDGNTGQQQNSDSGGEQPAQQDDNANQQEQEQPNDESANNQQQQQQDDPDMKNFQNFAGDTDFTDLFPKGVLSDAEIKEMREQQAEQKQRQEQEEQEEREKQRAEAEAEEEEQQQQQQQEQPASGTSNEAGEQQQLQQPAQPSEGSANSSEQGAASQDAQQPQPQRNTTGSEVVTQPQQQVRSQSPANKSNANTTTNLVSQSSPPTAAIAGLPSYMLRNVSTASANNQTGAQKTRRSRDHSQSSLPRPPSQPLLVLDSEYHDRYMKPFLNSLMTINKQQLSSQNDKSSLLRHSEPPPPPDDPGEWSQRKRRHEPTSGDQLMPLIDFDDLLEDYSDSLTNA